MKFLVSLVVFGLLLNSLVSAQTLLIKDSCKKAAAQGPGLTYNFCVNSLMQDPQSKAASSLEGLLLASTKNAAVKATNIKRMIEQILKDKKGQGSEAELRDCVELYGYANGSLKDAITNVKSQDYAGANAHLTGAYDETNICQDEIKEGKLLKSPITNENDILFQKILIALSFTIMLKVV